ncbi:MAG: hypothetical protein ACJAUG_001162 [Halioglobus sp.]|jgi:hypothetical protein
MDIPSTQTRTTTAAVPAPLTIKRLLIPLLSHPKATQLIKNLVYLCLLINFGLYVLDDYTAWKAALPPGSPLPEAIKMFSTSIDMSAWIGLILVFELETYLLSDESFTASVNRLFLASKVLCYVLICYAAYGYTSFAIENYESTRLEGVSSPCQYADQGTWLQLDVNEYVEISSINCAALSEDIVFYRVGKDLNIISESSLTHVQWMGWIDITNAFIWLLVVILIEIEVRLQGQDRFSGRRLGVVRQLKSLCYLALIGNGVVWSVTGYYVYAWDAFLWIFGFWAIELNLAEWEQDRLEELAVR